VASPFLAKVYAFKFLDGFLPIYPLYAVMFVDRGLSPWQVSITLIAWSATAFALQIPSGLLADRFSRRWLLAGAQAIRGLGFLAWLLVPNFWGFLLGLMLWGVKSAFTNGVFEALVYDELKDAGAPETYARVIGRAQGVGFAAVLISSLSAALTAQLGYPAALYGSMAAAGAATLAALRLPRARPAVATGRHGFAEQLRQGFGYALRSPAVPGLIAVLAMSQAFGIGLDGFWPVFGRETGLPNAAVAVFVAAIGACEVLGATLAHRVRGSHERVYSGVFVLIGLGLAAAAAIFQAWTCALICVIAGLFKMTDVIFDSRLHDAIPSEMRATLAAVRNFIGLTVMTLLLAAFGPLAEATSYRTAFLVCGALLAAFGIGRLVLKKPT
jgi:MFS family permease